MFACIQDNLPFQAIGIWLILSGIAGFLMMGIDKDRAVYHEWRIPERRFFIMALAGGSFGMALASEVLHHKSSKLSFLGVLYAGVAIWLFALQRIGFLGCLLTTLPHG